MFYHVVSYPSSAEEIRLLRSDSRITIIPSLQVTSKALLGSAFFAFFISSLFHVNFCRFLFFKIFWRT